MRALSPHSLQLFDGLDTGSSEERALDISSALTPTEIDRAEQLAYREIWRSHPSRKPISTHEPHSLAWFEQIEERRYARHGRWIPRLFEFHRHQGEKVLVLGSGLGTDWTRYAASGAHVQFCTSSSEQLDLVRRNFEQRGLPAKFHHAAPTAMPIADGEIDIVCFFGSAENLVSIEPVIGEIYRVLKPGGKIVAVLPAKYNSHYWQDFCFPWNRWLQTEKPAPEPLFSGRSVKQVFGSFTEHRIHKRHLRRSDLPHVWRWMLLPFWERIIGRYLIVKAFKPVTASMPVRAAA